MKHQLLYSKKVDLSVFKYGFTVPKKLHKKFLNGPVQHLEKGKSISGFLIYEGTKYPISIANADRKVKGDTIRILYKDSNFKNLLKELFPNSYNYLLDSKTRELQKIKIPESKAEYIDIYEDIEPYNFLISKAIPSKKKPKNPAWHRDELILALDLYFKIDLNRSSPNHENIIELSNLLNQLPLHSSRPDQEKFRNANGVHMKLMNFRAIDPTYPGKGLQRGGKLEQQVWKEFADNNNLLKKVADQIRSAVLNQDSNYIAIKENEEELEFAEGKVLYRVHRSRERNQSLIKKVKQLHLKKHGRLKCEVCNFDFKKVYGEIGEGYIECHHIIPISELNLETKTKPKDLALVCSNCHRMLHRKRPWVSIQELKKLVNLVRD